MTEPTQEDFIRTTRLLFYVFLAWFPFTGIFGLHNFYFKEYGHGIFHVVCSIVASASLATIFMIMDGKFGEDFNGLYVFIPFILFFVSLMMSATMAFIQGFKVLFLAPPKDSKRSHKH